MTAPRETIPEPTDAMIEAGVRIYYTPHGWPRGYGIRAMVEAIWRAMAAQVTDRHVCGCGLINADRAPVDCSIHGPWGYTDSTGAIRWFVRRTR